jgi:tetratricopeptide (TPR) repeat protein
VRLEKWNAAADAWGEIFNRSGDPWAEVNYIDAYIKAGNLSAARRILLENLKQGPSSSDKAVAELASCALRLGEVESAKQILARNLKPPKAWLPHQRLQIARVLALAGRTDEALAYYEKHVGACAPEDANLALIVDPGLTVTSGHHVNYTLFCWDLLDRLAQVVPIRPEILCRDVTLSHEIRDLRVRPELVFEPYAFNEVPTIHEYLGQLNACFYRDLSLQNLQDRVSLALMHSMRAVMIDGFSRWCADLFEHRPGVVVIGLIEVDHLNEGQEVIAEYETVYRDGLSRLVAHPNIVPIVYVETPMGKSFLDGLGVSGLVVRVYPYLAASLTAKRSPRGATAISDDPICLGVVGGTRRERGSWVFPRVLANTQDLAGQCRWTLQLNRQALGRIVDPADLPFVEQLAAYPNVKLIDSTLTSSEYLALLDEIDVVLLPYQDRYMVSGSGVFYEALYLGKYLIVPRDSFMPAELEKWGHPHRVLEEVSAACLETHIRWVVEHQMHIRRELHRLQQERRISPADEFYELVQQALSQSAP